MTTENKKVFDAMDGNTATAHSAYAFTEVAGIYPITPSSPMAEHTDDWATAGRTNVFGDKVKVVEMQAEGGAAGTIHGALQAGSLAATFTASQGLLLMIPNLYKLKGEMLPGVIHVAARSLATHTLSIFGDHQDVYACRQTGIVMMCSHSVQDCMDLAGAAHLIAIDGSVPVMHFFDGFRTSHEVDKIEVMDYDFLKSLLPMDKLEAFRAHALNPHGNAVTRGGSQNDDIYFQAAEAQNKHYEAVPDIAAKYFKAISEHTGRDYAPFVYVGAPDAERVIVAMGSVTDTITETINTLVKRGEKVGLIKVYLYRPFSQKYLEAVLPETVKKIAVLDRAKEQGAREPLFLDVCYALRKHTDLTIVGGRYGLSSKDTNPSHINAVYEELKKDEPKEEFTIGIEDDVTNLSLAPVDIHVDADYTSCLFYGLGSDGTVGANKSTVKIIGNNTDLYSQAYFAYDSRKAGGVTRSHLRFGKSPIHSPYYIDKADFISCSLDSYCFKFDMVRDLKEGGTFLLNTTIPAEEIADRLPNRMLAALADKKANFYIINATKLAQETHMGRHTNTILQSAFFALNEQIMPYDTSVELMKDSARHTYARKGEDVVNNNCNAIDKGKEGLVKIDVDPAWSNLPYDKSLIVKTGDEYFDDNLQRINALEGYQMPVSSFMKPEVIDGSIPENVSFREKRNIAAQVPAWNAEKCIECGQCAFACPHATIRPFLLNADEVAKAEAIAAENNVKFDTKEPTPVYKGAKEAGLVYRIQLSPANCVGCGVCLTACPVKALTAADVDTQQGEEPLADYLYKETEYKTQYVMNPNSVQGISLMMPYFEVSGCCPGCGEAPYYRLATQLFGKDMMVANATGCSMIYCSSTPSTPFVVDKDGNGVAWANSLFEDNAEFGFGMAVAQATKSARILRIMEENLDKVEPELKEVFEAYIASGEDRDQHRALKDKIVAGVKASANEAVKELLEMERDLVGKSVWIVGGDGWAYDIGYGGLDHVMANNLNVNVLVLDTEVYSNTGGQSSKSSQAASIAKFAAGGKALAKKDLGQIVMEYGTAYVASISMGANQLQTIKAFQEAESYNGPSIIIAYCPCAEQGIKGGLVKAPIIQKNAVECGYVTLYRYDPRNEKPLTIDSKEPKWEKFHDFLMNEARYFNLPKLRGQEAAEAAFAKTLSDAQRRYTKLIQKASLQDK
ncbi:MAG: pyruvate:ferredoxin (flavodoxin) oxidoreductase [Erysipelotrichaceae bacterium]|nr:pyruvate:ferredoxin (flavodoxin) oxidoreductase [Erysipelotrichaceae bacterium]